MTSLSEKLSEIVGSTFADCELPADLGRVQVSDRPDLAQFQCNGAMAAAKIAQKSPRDVAADVVAMLEKRPEFSNIEIAGPGFINLNVTNEFLQDCLQDVACDNRLGVPKYVHDDVMVLDYGGLNIAKPMHVGHLRASVIGDALRRICGFAGYDTCGDVHLGDWGTQMGMIISEYIREGTADRVLSVDIDDEQAVIDLMDELSDLYPRVSAQCKEDPVRLEEAKAATVKLQNKEPEYYSVWQKIFDASVAGMKTLFEQMNVHFDLWKGEACVHDLIAPMVENLKAQGLAEEDDGALIVRIPTAEGEKEIPPLILYKRDGAVMYGTTDMATIVDRMDVNKPKKIIYVVDQRQHLHFVQVFKVAKMSSIAGDDVELFHAGFGTMNGTDGKPFKTRDGGVMRLEDLLMMAKDKARERIEEASLAQDISAEEKEIVAHKVALAAIKYADLQNPRLTDYIFDLDRLISFEGKTGPYLLYQAVRIKSLLRKAAGQGLSVGTAFKIEESDIALSLLLNELPDYFGASLKNYMPHHLCEYAYKLASEFSRFYSNCHILTEEDKGLQASRLALCDMTFKQLELVLGCLGIEIPDRM